MVDDPNIDVSTLKSFGSQWERFDQRRLSPSELQDMFSVYFQIFPWDEISPNPVGFDLGCGTGRWAQLVAPRVHRLYCIDPSAEALNVARSTLSGYNNCEFIEAGVNNVQLSPNSMDFGYALGVLHHIPDPEQGLQACVRLLKLGAPLLLFMYYALDGRPVWYRTLFRLADAGRRAVHRLPDRVKVIVTTLIATLVYWPAARTAAVLESLGVKVGGFPLSYYRHRSFYTMRTDARDRFGTPLEHRFSKQELEAMLRRCGLDRIVFSPSPPYWCALGHRTR